MESKIVKINIKPNKNLLEEIYNISSKIYDDQKKIMDKIDSLEQRMTNIEKNISSKIINGTIICNTNSNIVNMKVEDIILEKSEIFRALKYRDYRSVLHIFRLYYKNKDNQESSYPIKITGKMSYEFYLNNKWHHDLRGHYIMNTVCTNVQNLFLKYNTLDYPEINTDIFFVNQDFIYQLSNDKFKKDVFKNIVEEIRINT